MIDIRTGKELNDTYLHGADKVQITRRDFLSVGIAAASAVALAGSANATVRHGLGARLAANFSGGGGGGDPYLGYVSTGLIGMWDGKDGVRGDVLKDLSGGGYDMLFSGDHSFESNGVRIVGRSGAYGIVNGFAFGSPVTMEVCCSVEECDTYGRFFAENRGLCAGSSDRNKVFFGFIYGFNRDQTLASNQRGIGVSFVQSFMVNSYTSAYYVDGVKQNINPFGATNQYSGETTFFNRKTGGRGITGTLHNIRFYNRMLSDDEVVSNYNNDAARFGIT